MARKTDAEMIGVKKGKLTVIAFDSTRKGRSFWKVRCDCGTEKTIRLDRLHNNSMCEKCAAVQQGLRMLTHGETRTSLYSIWRGIKGRCYNPQTIAYASYGAKGITMHEDWVNSYESFRDYVSQLENFGKVGYTLDRIDFDGNYEPNNLRWATMKEQSNNRKTNRFITFNGETLTIAQWSEKTGIPYSTILGRLKKGWSVSDVLTRKVKCHKKTFERGVSYGIRPQS